VTNAPNPATLHRCISVCCESLSSSSTAASCTMQYDTTTTSTTHPTRASDRYEPLAMCCMHPLKVEHLCSLVCANTGINPSFLAQLHICALQLRNRNAANLRLSPDCGRVRASLRPLARKHAPSIRCYRWQSVPLLSFRLTALNNGRLAHQVGEEVRLFPVQRLVTLLQLEA